MPRKREDKNGPKKGPNGHQQSKYNGPSFAIAGGSVRAIQRNRARRMAAAENMALKPAWRLLKGREDLWNPVEDMVSPKVEERRIARRKAEKQARKRNR